jgi:dipeptidyl aminopeptidase/acylaminoacyl peptidase
VISTLKVLAVGWLVLLLQPFVACAGKSPGKISGISVSPDGKVLAVTFVKDKVFRIYRIAVDTGKASRFTEATTGEELGPVFSPDGKLIAYSYVPENEHQRIIVMNVDGSNPRSLAESGTANLDATFAPDGRTIYFRRSRPPPHYHEWDIFSMQLDGSNIKQFTHEGFYETSQPSLSPDGKNLVMMSEGVNASERIAVYSLDHPEKPPLVLRPHVPKGFSNDPIYVGPQYLPGGKSILFMAAINGKSGYDYDVYRLDIASGNLDRLTSGNGFANNLCVFPDGKTAVFQKWHSDWRRTPVNGELYLLDLQSRGVTPFKVNGLN